MSISVQPTESMCDRPLKVKVTGLIPHVSYTLTATCRPQSDVTSALFMSHAHYISNGEGHIDVGTMASLAGTYTGIEPMGLVWSMEPTHDAQGKIPGSTFQLHQPAATFKIDFAVYSGHIQFQQQQSQPIAIGDTPIARQSVTRWSVVANRIPVRHGRLRGVLFVPQGQGRHPAIIDLYGGAHGVLYELRASTLAAYGFVTLALAYIGYDDLPDQDNLKLEYFIEAVDFIESLPEVDSTRGVGVVGECFGANIAMHLSIVCPKIKAVAAVSSGSSLFVGQVTYKGNPLPVHTNPDKFTINEEGQLVLSDIYPISEDLAIPLERSHVETRYLFISGEDDREKHWRHAECLANRLQRLGPRDYKRIVYPGAGHLLHVPYCPLIRASSMPNLDESIKILWGGEKYGHAHAQVSAQVELVNFFDEHLRGKSIFTVTAKI